MKFRVLGCSGAEFPGHNPPGFLIDEEVLFDAGSLTNVLDQDDQWKIKHIFITHAHLDHIRGIPFLADNIIIKNKKHSFNLISIPPVLKTISKNLLNNSIWPDFSMLPDHKNPIIKYVELKEGAAVKFNNYEVTAYHVNHSVPSVGYLIGHDKRLLFYTGDTGPTTQTWKKIGDRLLNALIIEVSFPSKMKDLAVLTGHLTPALLNLELAKLKNYPEKIYITHPKPQYLRAIKTELDKLKIKNVRLLSDGELISV
jgi:ribonuclease BN (tRNA processing enzyme)